MTQDRDIPTAMNGPSRDECGHRTVAEVLLARGEDRAAALVAASTYRCQRVDEWDGGQFEVTLGVPAALFDWVGPAEQSVLAAAARDVIGEGNFSGLRLRIRLCDPEPGWQRALVEGYCRGLRPSRLVLPSGAGDAGD